MQSVKHELLQALSAVLEQTLSGAGERAAVGQGHEAVDHVTRHHVGDRLTEASAVVGNTTAWDLTILATNLATTLPRAAYFCAWSSFQVGAAPLVRYSLVDQTNVAMLLNAPHIANRASVDWATYPILRFPQAPKVEVALINVPGEVSWGAGEPTATAIPAAWATCASSPAVHICSRSYALSHLITTNSSSSRRRR